MGELAESFEYGLNASAKKFDGSNKYIRITDIDDINHKFNQNEVTSPDIDFANADNYKLKKGDILFARTGASVGKTYIYRESDGLVYYAGFLIRARIKSKISSEFVFQTTFTDSYNQFIKITSQRSGQPGVNAEEYSNFKIMIPNYEEQNTIGCFFKIVDDTIALHQRKLEALQRMKQGLLQQLFPAKAQRVPNVRFADFNEVWEEHKLGEIAERQDNLRVPITASERISGHIPYYGANGIQDYVEGHTHDGEFILVAEDGANDLKKYPVQYVNGKAWVNNHAHVLKGYTGFTDNKFLMNAMKNINFEPFLVGGGRAKLNADVMMKLDIVHPTFVEQQKIGTFFQQLDSIITLHQNKLAQLKKLKKSFLQSMFI
ncbi:restriction endonuclease subunit S [Candidatus Enterococcus mangumiae]|uniref:Type I restriction enzyme, S subunit n=1 Tax=Candidatus Enterococcus mangumiae TaxID=2230878 RepID=A0ABZ2SUY9_9ENTE